MKNAVLFMIATLIWGSTWLVITFQLGDVHPLVSVFYRFAIAASILLAWCGWKKLFVRLPLSTHLFLMAQGVCLFGLNYWALYHGEQYITSALAAVMSTAIIYLNMAFGWLLLKQNVTKEVFLGAVVGVVGIACLFWPELIASQYDEWVVFGMLLVLVSSTFASLGNINSAYVQGKGVKVTYANTLSMSYATVFLMLVILVLDIPITIDWSFNYLSSLFYLSIFGSVIAFWAYLTLVGNIGASKASYAVLVYPAIALALSAWFEGYHWQWLSTVGLGLIVLGNLIAMNKWHHLGPMLRIARTRVRG